MNEKEIDHLILVRGMLVDHYQYNKESSFVTKLDDIILTAKGDRIRLLQYEDLQEHVINLADEVLGESYYSLSTDVYGIQADICIDVAKEYKEAKASFLDKIKKWFG